jgi:antitoxin ParD1/3/4
MNVSLTPEMEAFVLERVSCGRYRSNSEVLRAAIRLLESQERQETTGGRLEDGGHGQLAEQPLDIRPFRDDASGHEA